MDFKARCLASDVSYGYLSSDEQWAVMLGCGLRRKVKGHHSTYGAPGYHHSISARMNVILSVACSTTVRARMFAAS